MSRSSSSYCTEHVYCIFQTKPILVPQILIFTHLFLQLYAETFISKLKKQNTQEITLHIKD